MTAHWLSAEEFSRRESARAMEGYERRRAVAAEVEAALPVHEHYYHNGKRVPCGGKGTPTVYADPHTGRGIHQCRRCGRQF